MKTITKLPCFVIAALISSAAVGGCSTFGFSSGGSSEETTRVQTTTYEAPQVLGQLNTRELPESSGLTASRCNAGVLWTHNDSGNDPVVFAIDLKGRTLGAWKVAGAKARDWEDMASAKESDGSCFLYVGDIGDNSESRRGIAVYRIKEPNTSAASDVPRDRLQIEKAERIELVYPDRSHNAETLLVHPETRDIYVVTKSESGPSGVYRFKRSDWIEAAGSGREARGQKVAEISVPAIAGGFLTGGDISPDGRHLVLVDYFAAYELILPGDENEFEKIWFGTPSIIETGPRQQGESVAYSPDGNSLYLTSEKESSPLIFIRRKQ